MGKKSLLLVAVAVFFTQFLLAQERTVTGVVKSDDGTPLPGVTVYEKGTTNGTTSDENGKYSIKASSPDAVLVFSFIGMNTQERKVGANSSMDVSMVQGVELKEFVVDALGFEREKETVGTASSTLNNEQLVNTADNRLINSMAGKTAGVNITQSTGDPGAGSRIQIRGATSITGDLQPLIIVDGVPIYNDTYYGEAFGGNLAGAGGSLGSGGGVTQQSRLNDINPNDIESMEIIRGAAAAALWGSRAANGVIVITTKKGRAGANGQKVSVEVNSSVAFDQINREIPLNQEYGNGFDGYYFQGTAFSWGDKISNRSGGEDDVIDDPNDPGYAGYFIVEDEEGNPTGDRYYAVRPADPANGDVHGGKNSTEVYNPYEMFFKTGVTFDNSVSITAADDKGSTYFSFSDMRQDGIILNNSRYKRNTARVNNTRYLNDKWTLNTSVGYTRTSADRVQMGSNLNGLFLGGLRSTPDFNDEDYWGTYVDAGGNFFPNRQRAYRNPLGARTNSIYDNPFFIMDKITSQSVVDRVIGKVELTYDVNSWLNITWRNGVDFYQDKREDFFPSQSAGENNGGRFANESLKSSQFNTDLIARAKWTLNDDIRGVALLGTNINSRSFDDQGSNIRQFINPLAPANSTNGNQVFALDYADQQVNQGLYGSVNAELYGQLFVNASFRNDWLSTLPDDNRTVFYPAADAAWNFTKLEGLEDNEILSYGKLRAGWGQVGRGPDPFVTVRTYFPPTAQNTGWGEGWGPGLNPISYGGAFALSSVAANPNIRPEIKTEWEIGTDLRFANDRINASFTYYSNVTKDLIIQVDVPESSGALTQIANAAEITNAGIELELGADVVKTEDLVVNVYGNFTRNRNEVTSMDGTESILLSGFSGTSSRAVVGEQLGVLWGGKWDRDANDELILDANGYPTIAAELGVIGDPNPDYRAGFGTRVYYKGFSANVLFDMSQGIDMWNGTRGALTYFGMAEATANETTFTAEEANSTTNYIGVSIADLYPQLQNADGTYTVRGKFEDFGGGEVFLDEYWYYVGPGSGFTGPDEQFVEDASWTRLREVSLSYTFDSQNFKDKSSLQSLTIGFTGRNLLLWTDYQGNDPDQNLVGAGNNGLGLDYFQNPSTKSYMFNVNLRF